MVALRICLIAFGNSVHNYVVCVKYVSVFLSVFCTFTILFILLRVLLLCE